MKSEMKLKRKLVPVALPMMLVFITIALCLLSAFGTPQPYQQTMTSIQSQPHHLSPLGDPITWDVRMNASETGGKIDYVTFGEAPDGNDGPPVDPHDVLKPPAGIPPYIRLWFNDNLPAPYDTLFADYRDYPDTHKVWNLSVHWMPTSYVSTVVTIVWNIARVSNSEYDTIKLTNSTGVQVPNMKTTGSFTFTCLPYVPQLFQINCSVDTKRPQIINHSPGTGETGDSYTFNASIFDDLTPSSSLLVKVNWTHGSLSGNDTMTYVSGNYFVKTITLSNVNTNPLTYHFYARDTAKVPNVNYTSQYSATVTDDEAPVITSDSGAVSVGTGDVVTLWVQASDNLVVTSATATVDSTPYPMSWSVGNARWEYVFTAPTGSIASHSYSLAVFDAAANSDASGPYTITVNDNDAPVITNILATPSSQLVNGYVNITATITDNINLLEKKVRITGPAGYAPINISMTQDGGNTFYYNSTYTITGIYNYSIWAKDTSNNGITSTTYQFNIYAKLNITMVLTGWNFVSLPFNQTISKTNLIVIYQGTEYTWAQAVTAGHVIDTIFKWNRTSTPQTYELTDTLTPGHGYWIYAYHTCNIWATNLNPMVSTAYITTLSVKWNIFGVPVNQNVNKTSLIVNYLGVDYTWTQATTNDNPTGGPIVVKDLFGWNRNTPQGYLLSDILNAGHSYWIYSYYTCILKRTV
jgi:hypothetical protein